MKRNEDSPRSISSWGFNSCGCSTVMVFLVVVHSIGKLSERIPAAHYYIREINEISLHPLRWQYLQAPFVILRPFADCSAIG